jgi:hypothetical protein
VALVVAVFALVVSGLGLLIHRGDEAFGSDADRVLLLVPDGTPFADPRVTVWLDAASEEGIHLAPMTDSTFLRPLFGKPKCAGIILPDSIHLQASDLLVNAVREYVSDGGHLMLVYDAGAKSQEGFYTGDRSRFSDLAGVDYSLYNSLRDKMIQSGTVGATIPLMDRLGIPPGKYYPLSLSNNPATAADTIEATLRRYKYGDLEYPSFVTSGNYSGHILLRSKSGIVTGYHNYQKGSVLFVNLPVGYLDGYTDGLPLHAFLKYFAAQVLFLPYLMSVPDGVGGLVLNWHVDSNAAIKALQAMEGWNILRQGPYSIDVTAGPDTYTFGDHRGFDVLHNPISQDLIHKYGRFGNEIGSHGGWIHNYFADHVDKDDPNSLEKFLELNKDALEQVGGKPVQEYSAPAGNQPQWVTAWLEKRHFVGYYFTGDSGMSPTLGYREGQRAGETIWAFPIVHLDRAASFEEFRTEGYSDNDVKRWLDALTDFTVSHREVRLLYFHPPGILSYEQLVRNWLGKTEQLKTSGVFRWYTMVQIGNFLNARQQVKWKLTEKNQSASLEASHPQTLIHQTWWLPAKKFGQPSIVQGEAEVFESGTGWLVVASEGKHLKFETRLLNQ